MDLKRAYNEMNAAFLAVFHDSFGNPAQET